nr:MAG TPA: hypothetical protein [Caudoviricetes sp.]
MSTTIVIYFHQCHFVLYLFTFAFLYDKLATLPRVAAWHRR